MEQSDQGLHFMLQNGWSKVRNRVICMLAAELSAKEGVICKQFGYRSSSTKYWARSKIQTV